MLKNNPKDLTVNREEEASTNSYDITVSSENAEPWTLVTDAKEKKNSSPAPNENIKELPEGISVNDEENRVEIIEDNGGHQAKGNIKDVQKKSERNTKTKEEEEQEDISDGISIISECESVEAHPTKSENIHHYYTLLNNRHSIAPPQYTHETRTVLQQNEDNQILRQRHRNESTSVENALQRQPPPAVVDTSNMIAVLKRKLKILFYTVVFLAILAIIGKLYYPVWQNNWQDISLEQKLNDISLQNNLMRAEIDILNKQVRYLTTYQHKHTDNGKYKRNINNPSKSEHHFKAWQGIGDNIQPIEISKSDLRRPYKCSDGSFVEVAGMCIEQQQHEPSISQQFAHVVDDLKKESEAWQTFEKVANHLHEFQEKPFETIDKLRNEYATTGDFASPNSIPDPQQQQPSEMPPKYQYGDANIHFNDDYRNHINNRDPRKEIRKEQMRSSINQPNEKYIPPQYDHDNFKEGKKFNKNEREGNNKDYNYKDDKDYEYDSKQFHNKDKSKDKNKEKGKYKNKYNANNDGDWQENYMKNREEARFRNEHKIQDNNNWYIQRGQGREHKRYFDD